MKMLLMGQSWFGSVTLMSALLLTDRLSATLAADHCFRVPIQGLQIAVNTNRVIFDAP